MVIFQRVQLNLTYKFKAKFKLKKNQTKCHSKNGLEKEKPLNSNAKVVQWTFGAQINKFSSGTTKLDENFKRQKNKISKFQKKLGFVNRKS